RPSIVLTRSRWTRFSRGRRELLVQIPPDAASVGRSRSRQGERRPLRQSGGVCVAVLSSGRLAGRGPTG
ncbi:MAG: hypothetical protein ACK55Z_01590, partial [bacterium]